MGVFHPPGLSEKVTVYTVFLGSWLLFGLIIGASYKGDMLSALIAPKVQMPFTNFEELSQMRGKYYMFKGQNILTLAEVRKCRGSRGR